MHLRVLNVQNSRIQFWVRQQFQPWGLTPYLIDCLRIRRSAKEMCEICCVEDESRIIVAELRRNITHRTE